MSNSRERNYTLLENLKGVNNALFAYPDGAYLDYADFTEAKLDKNLVDIVNNTYFGRFDSDEDLVQAHTEDFGNWERKTNEEILAQYIKTNNRYYFI